MKITIQSKTVFPALSLYTWPNSIPLLYFNCFGHVAQQIFPVLKCLLHTKPPPTPKVIVPCNSTNEIFFIPFLFVESLPFPCRWCVQLVAGERVTSRVSARGACRTLWNKHPGWSQSLFGLEHLPRTHLRNLHSAILCRKWASWPPEGIGRFYFITDFIFSFWNVLSFVSFLCCNVIINHIYWFFNSKLLGTLK